MLLPPSRARRRAAEKILPFHCFGTTVATARICSESPFFFFPHRFRNQVFQAKPKTNATLVRGLVFRVHVGDENEHVFGAYEPFSRRRYARVVKGRKKNRRTKPVVRRGFNPVEMSSLCVRCARFARSPFEGPFIIFVLGSIRCTRVPSFLRGVLTRFNVRVRTQYAWCRIPRGRSTAKCVGKTIGNRRRP